MRLTALFSAALLAVTLACSGGGGSPQPTPKPEPPKSVVSAMPRGTYTATHSAPLMGVQASMAAPIGTLSPVLIVSSTAGTFYMEMPNFECVKGGMYVDTNGLISVSPDTQVTHLDGTTSTATLTGQFTNGHLIGSSNGVAFDLTVTPLQDQAIDLSTKLGTYLSTVCSNGQYLKLELKKAGQEYGWVGKGYATQADALADLNPLGTYSGSVSAPDPTKNCFNVGLQYQDYAGNVYGLGYFTDTGFLMLMNNTSNSGPGGGQLSAILVKQ